MSKESIEKEGMNQEREASSKGHAPEKESVKSAYHIAMERAASLLQRSDEELKQEDEKRMPETQPVSPAPEAGADAEKASEYLDHLQRLQAEFANYRKRVERERADFAKYAAAELIGELTEVLDDFERGLEGDHVEAVPPDYLKGIQGVYRKFGEILKRRGLERIKTVGETFNPEWHEAAMQETTDAYPPGAISGEIRPGYTLGERVLRAPLVKVAMAPAQEKTTSPDSDSAKDTAEGE